jgi:hypothetical protein
MVLSTGQCMFIALMLLGIVVLFLAIVFLLLGEYCD